LDALKRAVTRETLIDPATERRTTMSNVKTVQEIYGAFGRGDVPAILERLSEAIEWEQGGNANDIPWLQPRRGRAGVQEFFGSLQQLDFPKFEPKAFAETGNLVVALVDVELVVKKTGKKVVENDEVHLWWFDSAGRITRFRHRVDTLAQHRALQP
jgi:uncharacterized protein